MHQILVIIKKIYKQKKIVYKLIVLLIQMEMDYRQNHLKINYKKFLKHNKS